MTFIDFLKIANEIAVYAELIPLIAGIRQYKGVIWQYIFWGFLFEFLIDFVKAYYPAYATAVCNSYCLVELPFISAYYVQKEVLPKKVAIPLSIAILGTYFYIGSSSFMTLDNSYGFAVLYFFYTICGLLACWKIAMRIRAKHLYFMDNGLPADNIWQYHSSFFWTNTAFMFLYGGIFTIDVYERHWALVHKREVYLQMWVVRDCIYIIFYILIAKSFHCKEP